MVRKMKDKGLILEEVVQRTHKDSKAEVGGRRILTSLRVERYIKAIPPPFPVVRGELINEYPEGVRL
jgi:hypothetical protein